MTEPMKLAEKDAIHVLLVDDDYDDFVITRDLLNEIGSRFDLEWIASFEDGRRALIERRHDVCLLDYRLGEHSGLDLLRAVNGDDAGVPLIVLTGNGDDGIEQQALAAGAADYLVKGEISATILERSIRHAIERGRTLAALSARERQFRSLFDSALEAILITDNEGRYDDGNHAALELLGVSREELRQKRVFDLASAPSRSKTAEAWQRFLTEGRQAGEFQITRPDGQLRIVEFNARANFIPGRHLSVLRDITERRKAEETRSRLAAIVESTDEAIDGMALDGTIDYWSPAAERVYGYSADEILGQSQRLLLPPERTGELESILARVRRGESVSGYETVRRRKDGSLFDALSTISPTRVGGQIIGASAITRDISEKKRLEARLAVADRMASMGTLAAGVAHEINNPLAALMANLDHLAKELAHHPERATALVEALEDARAGADRIRQIVKDLKLFSRPDDVRRGPVDVRRVIESSIRMVWNEIRHRARLERDYGEIPLVEANEAHLGQVFLNLIVNAAQAIREGNAGNNEIRVRTRRTLDGQALIEVRDTGQGMTPETLKRIFEPFFTTKPVGIGTGLGLPICQRLVHELGGTITADSTVGKGSTFRVTLPSARKTATGPRPTLPPPHPVRAGRILVVDDEPSIGRAVQRMLAPEHDVLSLTSAREALERIAAGERFDVILCDLMMPEMTGQDLHEALGEAAPCQRRAMIFLTAGAFTPSARTFLDQVHNQHIEKPFEAAQLHALVNERVR
jgi:PAS domain S-box-containing protein